MRHRRSLVTVGIAAVLVAGGGFAYAESSDEPAPTDAPAPLLGSPYGTVTLPTGDQVRLAPDGTTQLIPAPGRESQPFFNWPGDDVVVVPADAVAGLADGTEDLRRYNVSALLAAGITDAAAVATSQLPGEPFAEYERSAGATTFQLTLKDRAGGVPDASKVLWSDLNSDEFGFVDIGEDGVGSAALPPGEYLLTVDILTLAEADTRGEFTSTVQPLTVKEGGTQLTVDAADGRPVTVEVDQPDAVLHGAEIAIDARTAFGQSGAGGHFGPGYDGYVIPVGDIPGVDLGMLYRPVLTSPEGAADPYVYWLAFPEPDGVPADPSYRASNEDLAIVDTSYESQGAPAEGTVCHATYIEWPSGSGAMCQLVDITLPSTFVGYYTPGDWYRGGGVGDIDDGYVFGLGMSTLSPGHTEATVPSGPLSVGESNYIRWSGAMGGWGTYGALDGEDTYVVNWGYTGSVVISKDGEELGREEGRIDFGCEIVIPDESGRYTLTATAERDSQYTPLAVATEMEWTFDSDPVEQETYLPLPHVRFTADGVGNGYADRSTALPIALELANPIELPQTDLVKLSLEISVDDGATWTDVAVDRDGNGATATLDLPDDGDFVSVRISATDDAGVELTHTTIRSFGLE